MGINKLIATSEEQAIGRDWRQTSARVRRRRPGSKRKRRARIARDHFINRAVKQLPWHRLRAIGFEELNGLKRGKSQTRGKNFRKAAAPWTYRRVRQRIECLASENRVLPVAVDPRGTSRTCPACGKDDRRNRKGELFRCIACDYKGDADFVGARNVLTKTLAALGRVLFPGQKMSAHQRHGSGQTVSDRHSFVPLSKVVMLDDATNSCVLSSGLSRRWRHETLRPGS